MSSPISLRLRALGARRSVARIFVAIRRRARSYSSASVIRAKAASASSSLTPFDVTRVLALIWCCLWCAAGMSPKVRRVPHHQ